MEKLLVKEERISDRRLINEIEHGKKIHQVAGEIWNWETPAGKRRWARRALMLTNHITRDLKVLELGCGTGYFTKVLEKTGADIIAIDISPDLLNLAMTEVQSDHVNFKQENAYKMTFANESFDSVVGSSVLHHLEIDKALLECNRVLKKGGTLFFTEPNMLNPQIAIQKNIPSIKEKLGESPDETAFFKWHIKRLLSQAGFNEVDVKPFDFLHPSIPGQFVKICEKVGLLIENIPILREFSGSLYIKAKKF